MKNKIEKLLLLAILCLPLLACSNYKAISNTKKLTNYEYTLTKTITLNDGDSKTVIEKGFVDDDIEKRITTIGDKEYITYFETNENSSFIYVLNKANRYTRKKIPTAMTSYLNFIDSDWVKFENDKVILDQKSHSKILRLLKIHKYLADDITLDSYNFDDSKDIISSLNITLLLLKDGNEVGKCYIDFQIENINKVEKIELPTLIERD